MPQRAGGWFCDFEVLRQRTESGRQQRHLIKKAGAISSIGTGL
jgi:hypothetical protein